MKKAILMAAAIFPALLFAQEEFTVKGKVSGLPQSATIYMQYEDGGDRIVDSAKVTNDAFTFHGMVKEPTQAYILLSREGAPFRELVHPEVNVIYLSKGVIHFQGDDFEKIRATGTSLNEEFTQYREHMAAIQEQMQALDQEFQQASPEQQGDPQFIAQLQAKATEVFARQQAFNEEYVRNNPSSYISMNLIEEMADSHNVKDMVSAYNALPAAYKATARGKRLNEQLQSMLKLAIGEVAPDFTLPDTSGNALSLSSLRGQYVLVDFWASWCGPCRQENPHVVAAYNQFKDKGFTVLGVSLDMERGREAWRKAIVDDQLTQWPHVSDLKGWDSSVVGLYNIKGIPQNFLLDKEGRIIASNLRGAALIEKLAEVLP